jgi:hypothetical protein
MKHMLRRVLTMPRSRTDKSYEQWLGYSKDELRAHIESQFSPGMSWERAGSFQLDHKFPIVAFRAKGISDPAIINSLKNLQVLTPLQNRIKSDKYDQGEFAQFLTAHFGNGGVTYTQGVA